MTFSDHGERSCWARLLDCDAEYIESALAIGQEYCPER